MCIPYQVITEKSKKFKWFVFKLLLQNTSPVNYFVYIFQSRIPDIIIRSFGKAKYFIIVYQIADLSKF